MIIRNFPLCLYWAMNFRPFGESFWRNKSMIAFSGSAQYWIFAKLMARLSILCGSDSSIFMLLHFICICIRSYLLTTLIVLGLRASFPVPTERNKILRRVRKGLLQRVTILIIGIGHKMRNEMAKKKMKENVDEMVVMEGDEAAGREELHANSRLTDERADLRLVRMLHFLQVNYHFIFAKRIPWGNMQQRLYRPSLFLFIFIVHLCSLRSN